MSMTEPLLMQRLGAQMDYLSERQRLLAANISNIDTPNFQAQDLKKMNFEDMAQAEAGKLALRTTSGKHLSGAQGDSGSYSPVKDKAAHERKPLGNNVSLEEQMGKVSDVGAQSQMATTLFRKFNQLYRTAVDSRA